MDKSNPSCWTQKAHESPSTAAAVVVFIALWDDRCALLGSLEFWEVQLSSVSCAASPSLFCCLPLCSVSDPVRSTAGLSSTDPHQHQDPKLLLIAVDSLLTSRLLSWKRDHVCSSLFRFYLYFKPHTRCRVSLELVTGAHDYIIHEEKLPAAAAK